MIDCSPEVLTCAVDFMYGIPIPEDFADIEGLLHQADLFMMEDLKSAAGLLIAKTLSLDTLKELVALGERYREVKLQESCGDFILAHIEEMQEEMISELALPPIARQVKAGSEYRPRFNFITSSKHQRQNAEQAPVSKSC